LKHKCAKKPKKSTPAKLIAKEEAVKAKSAKSATDKSPAASKNDLESKAQKDKTSLEDKDSTKDSMIYTKDTQKKHPRDQAKSESPSEEAPKENRNK
jgi:hypothetical protein